MNLKVSQEQGEHHYLNRRQLAGALTGLLLTMLLVAIDQTIVGTAMPRIIVDLNGFNQYPWVTTAYLLCATIAGPICAKLSDLYGRKGFLLGGNVLFVVASVLCGMAGQIRYLPGSGITHLIIFRGIQGIGAGVATALMFTIIGDIFAPAERAKYQGLFAAVYGLASMVGPTLGGWLTDHLSWRWAFYINLPVGIVAAGAILLKLPRIRPLGRRSTIDFRGLLSLIASLVPLLLALTWATEYGWTSPRVAGLFAVAFVMLGIFVFCERRTADPFLPLDLFREPIFTVSFIAVFILGMGLFGVVLYVPLFMQGVLGISATRSGSLLTPLLIATVAGSIFAGQAIGRTGRYRRFAIIGSLLATVGMFLMARMDRSTTNFQVVCNMIIAGLGMGMMQPLYTLVVQNAAPATQRGTVTGATQFFRSMGSTVGVAVFGSVLLAVFHQHLQGSSQTSSPVSLAFKNPLLMVHAHEHLAALQQYPGGAESMQQTLENVKNALAHGLNAVFIIAAIFMGAAVAVNFFLREVPLQKRASPARTPDMPRAAVAEPS